MTRSAHRRTAAVLAATLAATTGSVVAALGVAGPAAASVATPTVMFVDSERALWSGAADGSSTTRLTPADVSVLRYDASDTGAVVAATVSVGPAGTTDADRTYGLWVQSGGTSKVVATAWDTQVDVSPDGTKVYWTNAGALFSYTVATGAVLDVCDGCANLQLTGATATYLAVAPDGSSFALTGEAVDTTTGRTTSSELMVVDASTGVIEEDSQLAAPALWDSYLTYADAGTVVATQAQLDGTGAVVGGSEDFHTVSLATTPATETDTAVTGYYEPRLRAGQWWMFTDSGTSSLTWSTPGTDITAAPSQVASRADGSTSYEYVPVTATPAALASPARLAAAATTVTSAGTVVYGQKVGLLGYASYAVAAAPLPTVYVTDYVYRGEVQYSFDAGRTWHDLTPTTQTATVKDVAGNAAAGWAVGYRPFRTISLRWRWLGDRQVLGAFSPAKVVYVAPRVTVAVRVWSHGTRIVSGTASRSTGRLAMQVWSGGAWRGVTTGVLKSGRYVFAARVLKRGTYRVLVLGDALMTSNAVAFKV